MLFLRFKDFYREAYPDLYRTLSKLVNQVDRIDSASYKDVDQWFNCDFESAKLNLVLFYNRTDGFRNKLIRDMIIYGCHRIINKIEFYALYKKARERIENDFKLAERILERKGNIVYYDSTKADEMVFHRFFPYKYYPEASFVVGIYRKNKKYEVSVGKNPWKQGSGDLDTNIGELCLAFGGGGRKNVGGVTVMTYEISIEIANRIINALLPPEFLAYQRGKLQKVGA